MESALSLDSLLLHVPAGRYTIYVLCAAAVLFGIWKAITYTDIPYIKGLPEIPGALPITGHLLKLGEDRKSIAIGFNESILT
jgi:phenylacetate 2-hydroxylase